MMKLEFPHLEVSIEDRGSLKCRIKLALVVSSYLLEVPSLCTFELCLDL